MSYLKVLLRNAVKQKGYSFINILGLAIGIAVCSLIFLWVQDELSYDAYHENLDNIHKVVLRVEGKWWDSSNWALSPLLKQNYAEIERATRYASRNLLLRYGTNNFYEQGALVDEDFPEIFTYPFIEGDPKTALSTTNSIVLTETTAKKYFGSEDPMGRTLKLNNATDLTVTGIIADVPSNSTFRFGFLAPVRLFGEERLNSWAVESFSYVLVNERTSVPDLVGKISGIVMEHDTRTDQKVEVFLRPYNELHLYSLTGTGPILYVYLFSAIAVFILLIACINFMNLTVARAGRRAKEIGMRKVAGATKRNLVVQFFGESIVLSFVALLVAVLLIKLFIPAFNDLSGKQLALDLARNSTHLLGLLLITLLTGLVSGSYPALVLSSFKPITAIRASTSSGSSKSMFRKALVISQFAATIVLVIGSLVVFRQLDYISSKDLGFNRDQVVVVRLNNSLRESLESYKNEVKNLPGVINVTCASSIPTNVGNINPVYWEGQTADDYQTINWVAMDCDYFDTFEMTMAAGRAFSKELAADRQNYVINEEAAKLMDMESPVGKMFSIWDREGQIVGVVKNFHSRSLHNGIVPVVFTMDQHWDWSLANVFVKIARIDVSGTLDRLRNTTLKFAPEFPFDYSFLDEHFERQYRGDRRVGTIFEYASYIAIFISCLGLFGLTTYMVARRTKEIGIRKVLGASKPGIVTMLLKEFLSLILIANAIGWPVAYLVTRKLMSSYAYQADGNIWLFPAAGILSLLLAFLTISIQTLKAAQTDPVECLKYE
ncbi:MAG: ABC transporter permease [Candidatus Zixiibacteriota bacterium]|nr:MAG: ABC transporter permease [candidate division Zixibacteria bacterium]